MPQPKSRFGFRMTLGVTNVVALVMLAAGTLIIANARDFPENTIPAPTHPVRDAIVLLVLAPVLAWILAFTSKADRRCGEDYAFQLLATGALVGMMTMVVAHGLWALEFVGGWLDLPPLYEPDLMAIGMIAWGVGYFTFRVRGLK